ncbi:hypothetical protein Avbf_05735 [Armadillidium vulgare]|nr:hypothetical protein Avbf_05735 [Armadillidium vulgare]
MPDMIFIFGGYLPKVINNDYYVNPNLETCLGETPLFYAVESNQANRKISIILLLIDEILSHSTKDKMFDVNMADEKGFTAIYYAISKGKSYVFLYLKYHFLISLIYLLSFVLKFLIVRAALELEKALHKSKTCAVKCIRFTTWDYRYGSTKAKEQLQAMFDSTDFRTEILVYLDDS